MSDAETKTPSDPPAKGAGAAGQGADAAKTAPPDKAGQGEAPASDVPPLSDGAAEHVTPSADLDAAPDPAAANEKPIDAEFTPADLKVRTAQEEARKDAGAQPVTLAGAASLAVLAALTGGLIGIVFDPDRGGVDPALQARVAALESGAPAPAGGERAPLSPVMREGLAALEAEIAALQRRLDAAAQPAAETAAGAPAPVGAADPAALTALAGELDTVRGLAVGAQTSAEAAQTQLEAVDDAVRALTRRVANLDVAAAELAARVTGAAPDADVVGSAGAAGMLALAGLREAANGGEAFAAQLAEAQRLFPEDAGLSALAPLAEAGAPSRAALLASFPDVARAVLREDRGQGGGLVERVGRAVTNAVTVRRVDAPADSLAAGDLIARARTALQATPADLTAAAEALDQLQDPARAAATDWIAQARARAAIDAGLASVRTSDEEPS